PLPGRSMGVARSVHDPIELSGDSLTFIEAFDRKQTYLRHDARDSHSDLPACLFHCVGSLCDESRLVISLDYFSSPGRPILVSSKQPDNNRRGVRKQSTTALRPPAVS
ncbi:hypothetical protein, partial [Pseudomonas viridiflava]|uniref:hypothetical protein n=1 Tax=Pseudomonas viridiflava TaxID=33069 RepID=UPI00197FDF2A